MTTLTASRTEPICIRRGFEFRYRMQLLTADSNGDLAPQSLSGFTITPQLTISESKDGSAVSGVTPTITTVDSNAGIFDYVLVYTETPTLTVGRKYSWMVYGSHATVTGGKPVLLRIGKAPVVA